MEIAIIIAVVLAIVLAIVYNDSSKKAAQKKAEQERLERVRKDAAERSEQLRLAAERQAQRDKEAEKKRIQDIADRKKREVEQQRQAETQRLAEQRQAEERVRLKAAEQQRAEEQRLTAQRQAEQQRQVQAAAQQRQRNFCETGTDYCASLQISFNSSPANFGFATIKSLSRNHGVWNELDNGVAQLDSFEQLSQYIFSFGAMHQAKLKQAFQAVFTANHFPLVGQTIEIIDYGCGQGIGTVCFIDYIRVHTNGNCTISNVRLIEPSEFALKRAVLHLRYSLRSIENAEPIVAVHKELDLITEADLGTNATTTKVHIFSNILDVEDFNIQHLYQKVLATQQGINLFVCVSPKIMQTRNRRLDSFQNYFEQHGGVTAISSRSDDIPNPSNPEKPWRRYERVFKAQLGHQQPITAVNPVTLNRRTWAQPTDDLPF